MEITQNIIPAFCANIMARRLYTKLYTMQLQAYPSCSWVLTRIMYMHSGFGYK